MEARGQGEQKPRTRTAALRSIALHAEDFLELALAG